MIIRRQALGLFCLLILFTWSATSDSAQNSSPAAQTIIPLEGLDPVMLTQGKEVQGDMKFKVTRGQFEYIFANAENKATFEKDPVRYEIQLDGHCARMGAPTTGNPDLYAVHNGRIYIFGSEECQVLFKATPEKYLEVPPPPKSPSAEMTRRGQELIAKAVATLGGSKLDQLVSFEKKDVRDNQIKSVLLFVFPDTLRQETIRPTFTIASVVSPSDSFFVFNNRANPMLEGTRKAVAKELNHELIVLLRARKLPDFKAFAAGSYKIGETSVERVDVELSGFTTTLGIDPSTGQILTQTYHGRGPGGVLGDIAISYSDFRSVEGMSLPFKITATFDGQPLPPQSATIESITLNGQVDPATFKRPTAKP